jgi:tungstate transport system permease protein
MHSLWDAIREAFGLLVRFDRELIVLIGTSFHVSVISTFIASVIALPTGIWFGLSEFKGRRFLDIVFNTLLFLPTVVIGHFVYMFLTRNGPLGHYGLLFTKTAIITGQIFLALPIIFTMVANSVRIADRRAILTALTLGAGRMRSYFVLLTEIKGLILLAIIAGFGRVIAEIGVSMMLGGNIYGETRTITTGIALLTSRGEFSKATALGLVLLVVVFGVNLMVYSAMHRER